MDTLYATISSVVPKMWTLTLPWPPSVNDYWGTRIVKSRKTGNYITVHYLTNRARKFRTDAQAVILERYGIVKTPERIALTLRYFRPTRRSYDIDNFNKGVLDALHHALLIRDDSQIDELHCYWGETFKGGKVEIEVKEML